MTSPAARAARHLVPSVSWREKVPDHVPTRGARLRVRPSSEVRTLSISHCPVEERKEKVTLRWHS